MKVESVVEYFGSKAVAAEALGIGRANLTHWQNKGRVPEKQAMRLDRITNGSLKYNPKHYSRQA
jgi:DNA-binding transcriptional regulator YiaG